MADDGRPISETPNQALREILRRPSDEWTESEREMMDVAVGAILKRTGKEWSELDLEFVYRYVCWTDHRDLYVIAYMRVGNVPGRTDRAKDLVIGFLNIHNDRVSKPPVTISLRSWDPAKGPGGLAGLRVFVHQCFRNYCSGEWRKNPPPPADDDLTQETLGTFPGDDTSVEMIVTRERIPLLHQCLAAMKEKNVPENGYFVVLKRDLSEPPWEYWMIDCVLGKKPPYARVVRHRALAALKRCLEDREEKARASRAQRAAAESEDS